MTDPVKLSRERWDSLWRGMTGHAEGAWEPKSVAIGKSMQFDGITFLPAEYVLSDEPVRPTKCMTLSPPPCA